MQARPLNVTTCWRRDDWGEGGYGKIEMTEDGTYGACNMYYFMVVPTSIVPSAVAPVADPAPCEIIVLPLLYLGHAPYGLRLAGSDTSMLDVCSYCSAGGRAPFGGGPA